MRINSINNSQDVNFKAVLSKETQQYIATRLKEMPYPPRKQPAYNKEYKAFVKETISQIKKINPSKYCIIKITEGKGGKYFNLYSYATKEDMKNNNWQSQSVVSDYIYDGKGLLEKLLELKNGLFKVANFKDNQRYDMMPNLLNQTLRQSRRCSDGSCTTCG